MVSMAETTVSSQRQQDTKPTGKPKVKSKKKPSVVNWHTSVASLKSVKPRNVVDRKPDPMEVEMARDDLFKIAHPDIQNPFTSVEDVCQRLIPYHVLAGYDIDEKGGSEMFSKRQIWEDTVEMKTRDFMATLRKQVTTYNTIMKKRSEGEMRGEERVMLEQSLLHEEKQKLMNLQAQIEAKEKAEKEAAEAEAKEALAQAERERAEAQARAEAAQAQAEADSKAEALRVEAESLAHAKSQAKLESSLTAGPFSETGNTVGVSGVSSEGASVQLDGEDEDVEDDEDGDGALDGVWDDDESDNTDEEDNSEPLGATVLLSDDENTPCAENRYSKP